jgi:predicted nucleic acid-binding protein
LSDVLVDSNVLLDVLIDDATWGDWSSDALRQSSRTSRLLINTVIYAEVSVRIPTKQELDRHLPADRFVRDLIPYEAAFLAGKVYSLYRHRGGTRTSPLPDFFIGAHAAIMGYRLLTRDVLRYRSYFPNLPLITP